MTDVDPFESNLHRARRLGLGPPPWGPAEWSLINPAPDFAAGDPVKNDPDVLAAEAARDAARDAFDLADLAWLTAVQQQATLELRHHVGGNKSYVSLPGGLGRLKNAQDLAEETALAEAVEQATERRNDAWQKVVRCNEQIRKAQHAARVRLAQAEARAA